MLIIFILLTYIKVCMCMFTTFMHHKIKVFACFGCTGYHNHVCFLYALYEIIVKGLPINPCWFSMLTLLKACP